MRVKCEHPVVLQHPKFSQYACICRRLVTPDYTYTFNDNDLYLFSSYEECGYVTQFSPRRMHVTADNFEEFFFVDDDGVSYPAYLVVPCGKCELCKEKKAFDWVIRAAAESAYSMEIPLFITLTYATAPKRGVSKRHVQLFLKRLRIRLERELNWTAPLRYFLVAEYGTELKRPHYHLILWNFPSSKYDLTTVFKDGKDTGMLPYSSLLNEFIANTWTYGFVHIGVNNSDTRSVEYCSKYMRKDSVVPYFRKFEHVCLRHKLGIFKIKLLKRKCFMLCSRGSKKHGTKGLGYAFVKDNVDYYRRNPRTLDCEFVNKLNGKKYTYPLPKYFRDKFFPCISMIVPKDIRDCFRHTLHNLANIYYSRKLFKRPYYLDLLDDIAPVLKKYFYLDSSMLQYVFDSPIPDDFRLRRNKRYYPDIDLDHTKLYRRYLDDFYSGIAILMNYRSPYEDIMRLYNIKDIRNKHIETVMSNLPEIDIEYELYKLRLRKEETKRKRSKYL